MSNHSRRAVLAGIAAAPALAAPALALTDPSADAELIELGVELNAVIQGWHARRSLGARRDAIGDAACEAMNLPNKRHEDFSRYAEWSEYREKRWVVISAAMDEAWAREQEEEKITRVSVWDRIHERLFPLCEKILSLRPTTLAGLAVQARASSLSEEQLWNGVDEPSSERAFIEAVCAFCGIKPVPVERALS
jgi:hypothetical protein